jgi:hypothetical protein
MVNDWLWIVDLGFPGSRESTVGSNILVVWGANIKVYMIGYWKN